MEKTDTLLLDWFDQGEVIDKIHQVEWIVLHKKISVRDAIKRCLEFEDEIT